MKSGILAPFVAVVVLASVARAPAQCDGQWLPGEGVPGVSGTVYSAVMWDPDGPGPRPPLLIVGGSFEVAGHVQVNHIAAWDGLSWAPLGEGSDRMVEALIVRPDGGLVAAGWFPFLDGSPPSCVAQWSGERWSPLGGPLLGGVRVLAQMPSGDLVAAGALISAEGAPVNKIARWDGVHWSPLGAGIQSDSGFLGVDALAVLPGGDLVAGGFFSMAGGQSISHLARWNGSAWLPFGAGPNGHVMALQVMPNGDLVAGGVFTTIDGVAANKVARWNGTAWSPMGSGMAQGSQGVFVDMLALLANGDLIASGDFLMADGHFVYGIARWNGVEWSAIPMGGPRVKVILVNPDGGFYAGGGFSSAGGVQARGIVRWDGAAWRSLGSALVHGVGRVAIALNGDLLATGTFTTDVGVRYGQVARWDGTRWIALGGQVNGFLNSMIVLHNGDILVAGDFTAIGDVAASWIVRWDGSAWTPLGSGIHGTSSPNRDPAVYALVELPNGDIVAGGQFETAGGVSVVNVARWDGTQWWPLANGRGFTSSYVTTFAVLPNGLLVAGGTFTGLVATWDGTRWTRLGSGLSGGNSYAYQGCAVLALMPGGGLIAAGDLYREREDGDIRGIARWDGQDWRPLGEGFGENGYGIILSLMPLPSGELLASGAFPRLGDAVGGHIARWNGAAWSTLGSGLDSVPNNMAMLPNGDVVMGGSFLVAGDVVSASLARWRPPACRADLNCDRAVTTQDFLVFVEAFFDHEPGADIDHDGVVASQDFFEFLRDFFAGC